jgi:UDP-glucose:(heptosyl)LPS alpha-1,3-glucosyltransferase
LACLKILAAYQKEVSSDFVLKVAGKIDRFELSDVISQFGLSDKVEFLGVVKHVEKLYKEADTLILPTQYDPSSNACLEALACGCGVVTTRENGASEFLESGAGWVMDDSGEKGVLDYLKSPKKVDEISCLVSKSSLHKEALGIKALVEKRV